MPQNETQQSGRSPRRSSFDSSDPVRDNQEIADENQQSGMVDTEEIRNRAEDMDRESDSQENAGGISNRPLDEEQDNQARVPPRGDSKDGSHA
jgi:hypothetical protein